MNIKLAAAAAAIALSAGGFAHASTVIDFEELASGPTSSPISYPTATFSSSTGQFYINGAGVSQDLCPYNGNCVASLTVAFTNPVNNLSFTSVGDDSPSSVFVTITTTGGTFNYTGSSDGVFTSQDLQNLGAYSNITGLVVTNDDPAGLAYDNFKFDVVGVPEPAAWALMLAGFGLAGASLRARRVRTAIA